MRTKFCVAIAALLAIWAMKRYYSRAGADDLWWILSPTARVAGAATGTTFAREPGEGYFSKERLFLIEKSCAGINFMIAAFGMLTFTLLRRNEETMPGWRALAVSLLASYVAAVFVNATRIAIAMWLTAHPLALSALTKAQLHRVEGIAVYFGGLVLLHELVRRFDCDAVGTFGRTAAPLVWYYAITLGIPLANGASPFDAVFAKHALVVLVLPPVLIVLGVQAHSYAKDVARRMKYSTLFRRR